jgi:hypothetical protein
MIAILSPTKNMKEVGYSHPEIDVTKPQFLAQTRDLWAQLKEMAPWELESAFGISPPLAMAAACHFQDFDPEGVGTMALYRYTGLAFQSLGAEDFTEEEVRFCNDHLRIVSGFYGLLRPCDGIQPYRLEMGTKLRFGGKTLYQVWGDRLYKALFDTGEAVINLASKEYSKAVSPYLQKEDRFITCDFLTNRGGKWVTVATSAKMARGQMVRYLVQNQLCQPEQLQDFTFDGYVFQKERSDDSHYVFLRSGCPDRQSSTCAGRGNL